MQDDEEVDMSDLKKNYTVDDITSGLSKQMKISKKRGGDADMGITKTIDKHPKDNHALLKKKHKNKRNRSQLMF